MKHTVRFIVATFFALAFDPSANAFDLGVGLGAVDSMDDHLEPAASARIGWTETIYSQFYYWGKNFGPVTERNFFVTFAKEISVPGTSFLFAHYGVVTSMHRTSLYDNKQSRENPNGPAAEHKTDYNLGGILGLGLQAKTGPLYAKINWDSHIFLTGSPFIIFLTSARKQTIALLLGVDL